MFGVKRGMHARKSISYLKSNREVGHWFFWGCFVTIGPEALFKINVIMNSTKYQYILAEILVVSARRLRLGGGGLSCQRMTPLISIKMTKLTQESVGKNNIYTLQLPSVTILKSYQWPVWTEEGCPYAQIQGYQWSWKVLHGGIILNPSKYVL